MNQPPVTPSGGAPVQRLDPSGQLSVRRFGVVCVLAYVLLSWAARFDMRRGDQIASLVYPLDTFSMYAPSPGHSINHLMVRDGAGNVHRVAEFRTFDCVEPLTGADVRCADQRGFEYHYDDLINFVRAHPGAGDTDVELIARTWAVQPWTTPRHVGDCVIAHCKVSR